MTQGFDPSNDIEGDFNLNEAVEPESPTECVSIKSHSDSAPPKNIFGQACVLTLLIACAYHLNPSKPLSSTAKSGGNIEVITAEILPRQLTENLDVWRNKSSQPQPEKSCPAAITP